jgi:hypothetical protein
MAKMTERWIEDCRHRLEAGDKTALLDAIDFCARSGTVMPLWLAEAYCAGYTAWATYKVRSLDQAFDVVRKGRRIPDLKKGYASMAAVAIEVNKLHQEQVPIDDGLFEQVSEKLNIPVGQVRALYYDEGNSWRQFYKALNKLPPKPIGLEGDSD